MRVRFTLNCFFPFKRRRTHTDLKIHNSRSSSRLLMSWLLLFISCDRLDSVDSNEIRLVRWKHTVESIQFKLKSIHISKFSCWGGEREKEMQTRSNEIGREIHGKWIFRYFSLFSGMCVPLHKRSEWKECPHRLNLHTSRTQTTPRRAVHIHSDVFELARVFSEFFRSCIVADNLCHSRYVHTARHTNRTNIICITHIFLFTKLILET